MGIKWDRKKGIYISRGKKRSKRERVEEVNRGGIVGKGEIGRVWETSIFGEIKLERRVESECE